MRDVLGGLVVVEREDLRATLQERRQHLALVAQRQRVAFDLALDLAPLAVRLGPHHGQRTEEVEREHARALHAARDVTQEEPLLLDVDQVIERVERREGDVELLEQRVSAEVEVGDPDPVLPGLEPTPRHLEHRPRDVDAQRLVAGLTELREHAAGAAADLKHLPRVFRREVQVQRCVLAEVCRPEAVELRVLSLNGNSRLHAAAMLAGSARAGNFAVQIANPGVVRSGRPATASEPGAPRRASRSASDVLFSRRGSGSAGRRNREPARRVGRGRAVVGGTADRRETRRCRSERARRAARSSRQYGADLGLSPP